MSGHHPLLLSARRHGCWCECACGWLSRPYTTVSGACCAFGEHLLSLPASSPETP